MADSPLTRREFAGRFAMTAGAAAGIATVCSADEAPDEPHETQAPPQPNPEDYLLAWLLSTYPAGHLTDEAIAGVRADIRGNLAQAERLRDFPLDNSDGPSTIFRAWRKE